MLKNISLLRGTCSRYLQARLCSMQLQEVVTRLNGMAPTSLAGSWDNVGLLIEPYTKREIKTVLLTNDLTEAVMDEAEERGANMILSYHPPLFRPFKKITRNTWKERIAARCLEQGIAVYSPHTCYDALNGGVNDWLIQAFEASKAIPIEVSTSSPAFSHKVSFDAADDAQATQLYAKLRSLNSAKTVVSLRGNVVEVLCDEPKIPEVVGVNPGWEPVLITKLEKVPILNTGMGRQCQLSAPITVSDAVAKVKAHTGLPHIRLALAHGRTTGSMIKTVAVCAGSGSSVLRDSRVDLWLTGEMSHHEVLDATHNGTSVILTDHSNTERGFLKVLQPRLHSLFEEKLQILVSEKDRDPLEVV